MPDIISNSPDFSVKMIGTVLSYDRTSREIICYIPQLMSGLPSGRLIQSYIQTNPTSHKIYGYSTYKPTIQVRNGKRCRTWNQNYKIPDIGSKVQIEYLQNNPDEAYWYEEFNANGEFVPIPEETYDQLFNFQVNDQVFRIDSEDRLVLNFNSENVTVSENNKVKTMNITIPNEILFGYDIPTGLTEGKLWFNQKEKRLYIYHNSGLYRLVENTELEAIYEFLSYIGKKVKYADYQNTDFTNLEVGDIVFNKRDFIIYKTGEENLSGNGYSYLPDMNLFVKNGEIQSGFKVVVNTGTEEAPSLALRDLNGILTWNGTISSESNEFTVSDAPIRMTRVSFKLPSISLTDETGSTNNYVFSISNGETVTDLQTFYIKQNEDQTYTAYSFWTETVEDQEVKHEYTLFNLAIADATITFNFGNNSTEKFYLSLKSTSEDTGTKVAISEVSVVGRKVYSQSDVDALTPVSEIESLKTRISDLEEQVQTLSETVASLQASSSGFTE